MRRHGAIELTHRAAGGRGSTARRQRADWDRDDERLRCEPGRGAARRDRRPVGHEPDRVWHSPIAAAAPRIRHGDQRDVARYGSARGTLGRRRRHHGRPAPAAGRAQGLRPGTGGRCAGRDPQRCRLERPTPRRRLPGHLSDRDRSGTVLGRLRGIRRRAHRMGEVLAARGRRAGARAGRAGGAGASPGRPASRSTRRPGTSCRRYSPRQVSHRRNGAERRSRRRRLHAGAGSPLASG